MPKSSHVLLAETSRPSLRDWFTVFCPKKKFLREFIQDDAFDAWNELLFWRHNDETSSL